MHALRPAQPSWRLTHRKALPQKDELHSKSHSKFCSAIGRLAVRSLHAELKLYPKPGLVSHIDNGSHKDMDANTFMRSLFSLRHYFVRITWAGFENAPFESLKQLGIEAEQRMLQATSGINTHRGAIFCLGMLCATAGLCRAQGIPLSAQAIRNALLNRWGEALRDHSRFRKPQSHGQRVARDYAVSGAREEAALGLPSVFDIALPALQNALDAGRGRRAARIDALFSLMAHINDTNVYYRRGILGANFVKACSQEFLRRGGTACPDWQSVVLTYHNRFIEMSLSPGGSADLLAATCFIHELISYSAELEMREVA